MNKKFLYVLGGLCILASGVMYFVGKDSSHLSELKDYWWIPLPLGVLCYLIAGSKK